MMKRLIVIALLVLALCFGFALGRADKRLLDRDPQGHVMCTGSNLDAITDAINEKRSEADKLK